MRSIRVAVRSLRLILGASCLGVLALGWFVTLDRSVDVDGEVLIQSLHRVRPAVDGSITVVRATPESQVAAGDVLIEVADLRRDEERSLTEIALQRAEATRAEARARKDRLRDLHRFELAQLQANLKSGRSKIERLRSRVEELRLAHSGVAQRLSASRQLEAAGLISREAVRQNELAVGEAKLRIDQAELQVAEERANAEAEQQVLSLLERRHAQTQAEIDAEIGLAEEQRLEAELRLRRLTELGERERLRAEIDGLFIAPSASELVGRRVQAGELLATVVDPSSVVFRAWLSEQALVLVEPGQTASLELHGFPKGDFGYFPGRVETVARSPEPGPSPDEAARYRVEIRLERPWVLRDGERFTLREGMAGRAKIVYSPDTSLFDAVYHFLVGRSI